MFTPPFKGPDGKLTYDAALREQALKGTNAGMIYPEMARDTVRVRGDGPGAVLPDLHDLSARASFRRRASRSRTRNSAGGIAI